MKTAHSRRHFFWKLADEAVAIVEKGWGKPSYKLLDLPQLQNEQLAQLPPMLAQDVDFFVEGGTLCAARQTDEQPLRLFEVNAPIRSFLERCNGSVSMGEIAQDVARLHGLSYGEAFALARRIFLLLVSKCLAFPATPPPDCE
jgi:hypothetical protein